MSWAEIHGRKNKSSSLKTTSTNPVLTKTAFAKLAHQHQVFALLTIYGSSPCTAILEDLKKEKIPAVATVASVQTMFDPPNRYMFWYANERAGRRHTVRGLRGQRLEG